MPVDGSQETFWKNQAKALSMRINFAWFLQVIAAPLLLASAFGSIATVIVRREFPGLSISLLTWILVAIVLLVALVSLVLAAHRFENPSQALVRLEADSGLNSALSAAAAGVSQWPEKPTESNSTLKWHLPRTIAPALGSIILLAAGLLIPLTPKPISADSPAKQPQAWSQLDSQLEQLAEDAMVDEKYIEEMEKRLDQLRAQEEEEWFSHASLEATDTLKETQKSNLDELERDLSEAEKALNSLTENADKMDSEQKQKLTEQFEDALKGLQNGAMKPNPELLDQLSKLDPNNLGKLTPEQLSQLKENMEKLQQSLDKAGQGAGQGEDWEDQLLGDGEGDGQGQGEGMGQDGEGTGSGGIQRGPGHDPNVLRDQKDALTAGELAALKAEDLSRAIPGDLLQLQDGEHDVDPTKSKASAGGAAAAGKGGDRIWRDSLAPDEQRTLKKYFE